MRRLRARLSGTGALFWVAAGALALTAIGLRVLLMIGYTPGVLSYPDEASYVKAAAGSLFSNPFRPAGYSLFLKALHLLSGNLQFTIALQHVLGLATAVLAYAVCRATGASRWIALIPAAVVALSGDQLYLEHVLLSDGLYIAILLLSCYCALRVLDKPGNGRFPGVYEWGAAAAAGAGFAAVTRTVGVALVPVFVAWLLAVGRPRWRARLAAAGLAVAVCGTILLTYAFAQQGSTGVFGLSRFSGWPLYSRVATFADCRRFTPPVGTRALCQSVAQDQRPGPAFYLWDRRSPAQRAFGFPPAHGALLARFARAAILGQPGDYLSVVGRDLLRYVNPYLVRGPAWGTEPTLLALNKRLPSTERSNLDSVRSYWHAPPVHTRKGIVNGLEHWRKVFRIHGPLVPLCALLALAGLIFAADTRTRRALALLLACSAVLLVTSVAVTVYDIRNGIPPELLLVVAAATGAEALALRIRARLGLV